MALAVWADSAVAGGLVEPVEEPAIVEGPDPTHERPESQPVLKPVKVAESAGGGTVATDE